jgi:hypothetical protein
MMGKNALMGWSAGWKIGLALVLALGASAASAASGSSAGCPNGSTQKDCSFQSGGLQQTFSSGGTTYGGLFSGGFGGGNPGANGFNRTGQLGSSRFALNSGDTGKAAAGMGSKWNAWLSLSQSNIAYQFQPLQSSGRVNLSLIGVDYTFANNATVGVVAGWDQTRVNTTFNGGNLGTNGNIVAPYLSWRFTPAWSLDASLGFGRANTSQTDNSVVGGITGNYSDKRTLGSVSVSYAKMMGKWQLTGRGSYLASEDKLGQFTLSNGNTIAGVTNRNAQVRLGGQAMYNGGVFLPYAGLYYFNDVQRVDQGAVGGVSPANDRDGFQVQLGIQFAPKGQIYGGLMVATDVGRSQVKNDLFLGNIGIRF